MSLSIFEDDICRLYSRLSFLTTRSIRDHLFLFVMAETIRKDCSLSQIKSNIVSSTCEAESEGEEVIVSYEGKGGSIHSLYIFIRYTICDVYFQITST